MSAALRQKSSVYESALENAVEDKFGDIVNLRASESDPDALPVLQKSVNLYRSKDTVAMRFFYDEDDKRRRGTAPRCTWDYLFLDVAGVVPYPREHNRGPMVLTIDVHSNGPDPVVAYELFLMPSPVAACGSLLGPIRRWDYQESDDVIKFWYRQDEAGIRHEYGHPARGFSFLDARDGIDFCRALKSYEFAMHGAKFSSVMSRAQTRNINVDFLRAFHRDEIRSSLQKAENGDALYPAYELYEPFVLNEKSIKFTSADVDAADAEFLDDEVEVGNLVVDASGGTVEGRKIVSLHMVLPARVL